MPTEQVERFVVQGPVLGLGREALKELLGAVLEKGRAFRFEARGQSMHPFIRDTDVITVAPLPARSLRAGEIVAFCHPASGSLVIHRIREVAFHGLLVQGDNLAAPDGVIGDSDLIGLITRVERGGVEVYRGEEPPGAGDRLAWSLRMWLVRIARHLAALERIRLGPETVLGSPGYSFQ